MPYPSFYILDYQAGCLNVLMFAAAETGSQLLTATPYTVHDWQPCRGWHSKQFWQRILLTCLLKIPLPPMTKPASMQSVVVFWQSIFSLGFQTLWPLR
jgi:hypothetical protein